MAIDVNRRNFFKYLYLSGNKGAEYDSSVDYRSLYETELTELIQRLKGYYSEIGSSSSKVNRSRLKEVVKFSYVCEDSYLKEGGETTGFYLSQFIESVIREEYRNRTVFFAGFTSASFSSNYQSQITEEALGGREQVDRGFEQLYRIDTIDASVFSFGARLKLKAEYDSFSSLTLRLGISAYSSKVNLLNDVRWAVFNNENPKTRPRTQYKVTTRAGRSYSINFRMGVPLYYANKRLSLHAGMNLDLLKTGATFDLTKSLTLSGNSVLETETVSSHTSNQINFIVSPSVYLVYQLPWRLDATVSYDIPVYTGSLSVDPALGFGVGFRLF